MKVFISGGARGIGKTLVKYFLQKSWDVGFTYFSSEDEAKALTQQLREEYPTLQVMSYKCDISQPQQVDDVSSIALSDFENFDALVCNAGVVGNSLALQMSNETWQRVIDTNLNGSFYLCRAFLESFLIQRSGSIVLISSVLANGSAGQAAYAASKAGLIGLGKTLAKEYGHKNIRCNIVSPGYVTTDMTTRDSSSHVIDFWNEYNPMHRPAHTEEISPLVGFLCSSESSYINGSVINVDGGMDWLP